MLSEETVNRLCKLYLFTISAAILLLILIDFYVSLQVPKFGFG